MELKKDQIQVIVLSVVLAFIVGMLLFSYRDRLLPKSDGGIPVQARTELNLPASFNAAIFDRQDFKQLRGVEGVPLQPVTEIPKNERIFALPEQTAQ